MTKKELWNIFMKTGKVSDYLNYRNAEAFIDADERYDAEFSQELGVEKSGPEDFNDDLEDRWNRDS